MHLEGSGLSIVFNGEIYNFALLRKELEGLGHRFRSHSDTEVILTAYAEWGTDCVGRLNGMFAFAIHDSRAGRLFLARDRAGEKPLYFRASEGVIQFASELKALLAYPASPRKIDPAALDSYLMVGYVPGSRCILLGYNKLPPAHALSFDFRTGSVQTWRYWKLPEYEYSEPIDLSALVDEFEDLLEDSVNLQLQADVPVGVLLSGGVDSSLVTAMAVRHSSDVRTYSIGFPGHNRFDETTHSRKVARYFGTQHTELTAEPASADLIPRLAWQYDEPIADSSMIPTFLVSRLVRRECTVALGGDGGDELFGGYTRYSRILQMAQRASRIPNPALKVMSSASAHLLPVGFKGRSYIHALGTDWAHGLPQIDALYDAVSRRKLMRNHGHWPTLADNIYGNSIFAHEDLLQRSTRKDFENLLPEDILVKVDRASMLNSLEVRAPFLDYRIIEFAFRNVPSSLKATVLQRKIIPKLLTEKLLPPDFDRKRKQGFAVPMTAWLRKGPFRELFFETLYSRSSIFDRRAVRSLMAGQRYGLKNSDRLYALVFFELWRETYDASL